MPDPTVAHALAVIARNPFRALVAGWNWKAALLSALYRAIIFFAVAMRGGWKAALAALSLEAGYRVIASGFQGAITQSLNRARPQWLAAILILFITPAILQAMEYFIHWLAGTPGLWTAFLISTAAAAVASLFSWFAMRRGALLVGENTSSFGDDLKQMPQLIWLFLSAIPRAAVQALQKRTRPGVPGRVSED
jgi:hypothetical protein